MISDEAVEAAYAAYLAHKSVRSPGNAKNAMREALEAAAPYMRSTVSTVRELEELPRLSVIRTDEGTVYERHTMWHEAGSRDLKYSPDIMLPATVLQLGWGEE